jgi:hypothetical protein
MRLLKCNVSGEFSLTKNFGGDDIPRYAILSHTWGPETEEVTLRDLMDGTGRSKFGYKKIRFCAEQAMRDGVQYFWVDTCCIDMTNNIELSEAINSMFRWYRDAVKCYVFLLDVSFPKFTHNRDQREVSWEWTFRQSRWFTRSWLLQELLAPASVEFFTREGQRLGDKTSLEHIIHEITGIPVQALRGEPFSHFSIEERFSWASTRQATRAEDWAYSLVGIFDVFLPTIYGEGRENAVRRLRKEIGNWEAPQDPLQLQPHYSHLVEGRFRILIINPGTDGSKVTGYIAEHDIFDPLKYNALSYTWGDEPPIHRIDLNYEPYYVPPNLFHALQRLRSPMHHVFLWVDFICINQSDEAEKSTQVKRMADIYQKAQCVLIWLGEEGWTSKQAMKFISQVNRQSFPWDGLWWKKDEFAAFNHILDRPWFRRRWVIQEAAYSANAFIYCGDRQVKLDDFACAVRLVRQKLHDTPFSVDKMNGYSDDFLGNFRDSPATRLLDIIGAAFHRSAEGAILRSCRRLSLETLVDLSSFCETKKPQDAVFALLSLANDLKPSSEPHSRDSIAPDYCASLLDVFGEFILHCCRSGSLDIICRPWAPLLSSGTYTVDEINQFQEARMCSWVISRELPAVTAYRQQGKPLVGSSQKRVYNAHYGTVPQVRLGRIETTNACDGSLYAKGIVFGEITQRSTRMANGIITYECLDVLQPSDQQLGLVNDSDAIWRIICADRDNGGDPTPAEYRSRLIRLFQLNPDGISGGVHNDQIVIMPSIDVEELLATKLPEDLKEVLEVVQGVV